MGILYIGIGTYYDKAGNTHWTAPMKMRIICGNVECIHVI